MKRGILFLAPIIASIAGTVYSVCLNLVSENYRTYHWYFSVVFFLVLNEAISIVYMQRTDARTSINNSMASSIGRLLASGTAFLIYGYLYPFGKTAMIAHFIPHYFLFTLIELFFLLKLVKRNS